MIKIIIDTEEELNIVRGILRDEACSHKPCTTPDSTRCADCVEDFCKNKVRLYKKEIVEIPASIVV